MSSYAQSLQHQVDSKKHDAQRRFGSWFVTKFKAQTKQPRLCERDEAALQRERSERLRKQTLTAVTNLQSPEYYDREPAARSRSGSGSSSSSSAKMQAARGDAGKRQQSYLRSQLQEMKRLSHEALLRHRRSMESQNQAEDEDVAPANVRVQRTDSKDSVNSEGEEEVKSVDEGDDALLRMGSGPIATEEEEAEAATHKDINQVDDGGQEAGGKEPEDNQAEQEQEQDVQAPEPVDQTETATETETAAPRCIEVEEEHKTEEEDTQRASSGEENTTPRVRDRRGSAPEDIERRMAQAALLFEEAMKLAEQALHIESPLPASRALRAHSAAAPPSPVPVPTRTTTTPSKPVAPVPRAPLPSTSKLTKPSYPTRRRAQTVQKAVFAQPENEWI